MPTIYFNPSSSLPGQWGETPGSIDNDPKFQKLANGAWQAIQNLIKTGSNTGSIELIMEDVNALYAYFQINVPSKTDNPLAFAIYTDLSSTLYGNMTLASACHSYGTSGCPEVIAAIEKLTNPFGTLASQGDPGTGFEADLNALPSVNSDEPSIYVKGNNTWQDFQNLMNDLLKNDGSTAALGKIAQDIVNLDNDLKNDNISDGYTTNILSLFQTVIPIDSGSANLLAAAEAFNPNDPASVAAFKAVMTAVGEPSNAGGGALYNLLKVSFFEEEFPLNPPT